ncbi:MAG: electron transfer flavoprotein subunit alpha/FixB family protein [Candidatus Marinimicrobia bacterium]|nr:electron transfer flavoprotein subunit alpha/FixB family protein [Candidatus Neomarinimicrobiota bacterium]
MSILVFIQQENGKINRLSLEAITGAQQLGAKLNQPVTACVFDENSANELKSYKLDKIVCINDSQLVEYNPITFANVMEQIISNENSTLIIAGHTYEARDWIPRLSARLDLPFVSDCTGFKTDPNFVVIRSIYQGKISSDVSIENNNGFISFQSGSFRADEIQVGSCEVIQVSVDLSQSTDLVRPGEKFQEATGAVDLSRAKIIVSVGRGIGKEENLPIAEELAKSLNAEIGASRPVVDYGWLPHERQVGSSGQTVIPKMYLALGISGAVQHQVGMKGSDCIVAINKDPNAPIFEIADYGIVEDLFEIVPKLTEKLNAR